MESSRKRAVFLFASIAGGALVGFALFVLPTFLHRSGGISLSRLIEASVKDMGMLQVCLLFVAGIAWGIILRPPYSLFAAAAQTGVLPLNVVIDIIADPTSHNLWPFEFAFYLALSFDGLCGALLGSSLRK